MPTPHRKLLACAVLIGAVLFAFGPAFDAEFLDWDDDHNIYENPRIRELSAANLRWMFTDLGGDVRYKPLGYLAWAILHAGFGLDPRAYHAANLVLHGLNALLLYFVLIAFLKKASPAEGASDGGWIDAVALIGAAAWALHPLRVEPVAWACVLPYLLATTFVLLALRGFVRIEAGRSAFGQSAYWQALLAYTLALLSFPIAIGAAALFIGLSLYPLRRLDPADEAGLLGERNRRALLELAPFVALAGVAVGIALYGAHIRQGHFSAPPTLSEFPLPHRIMQAAYIWCYYLWKALLPVGLSPVYQTFVDFHPTDPPFLFSGMALVGGTIWVIRSRRRFPELPALWVAHLGVLAPVLGVNVLGHVQSDRYAILHGLVLSFALVAWLVRLADAEARRRALVIAGIAAVAMSVMSRKQCRYWQDDVSFFTRQVETLPDSGARAAALFRLGTHYFRLGDLPHAVDYFERAIRSFPDYRPPDLYFRYGEALYALGRFAEAEKRYRQALALRKDAPEIWYGLGQSLIAQRRFAEVIPLYTAALVRHPDVPEFHDELAGIHSLTGNEEAAARHRAAAQRLRNASPR